MSALAKAKRRKPRGRATTRRKAGARPQAAHAPVVRARRKRPPPVTHEVIGLRCRVKEVLLLDETLVLQDEVDGRTFALPLPVLVGRDALANIEPKQAMWLSVRAEGRAKRGAVANPQVSE